jgi:hypothetical protein
MVNFERDIVSRTVHDDLAAGWRGGKSVCDPRQVTCLASGTMSCVKRVQDDLVKSREP